MYGDFVMDTQSFYTRHMLLEYGRQMVAARRLARYEQLLGRGSQTDAEALAARRRMMVERIAREIMENLIFSGSENYIVQEVRRELAQEMGEDYIFRYPPAQLDFQIFRKTAEGEEIELSVDEKHRLMGRLWEVTLRTVDATML